MLKRLGKLFGVGVFALALAACAGAAPPPGSAEAPASAAAMAAAPPQAAEPAPPPPIAEQLGQLKSRLYILVLSERGKLIGSATPLTLDAALTRAAQAHSDDMARKRSFDEKNPDGNIAVNVLLGDPKFRGLVGENSAAQYFTPTTGFDPDAMARGFLDIWLASPGHKNNLADPRFGRTGIGVAANGDAIYAAEIFADDSGLDDSGQDDSGQDDSGMTDP